MRVADLMQTNLKTIRGTDTIGDAVALLAETHVSGLPVIDERGRLAGVLSNSDILGAIAEHPEARDRLFEETMVREVMTPRPEVIAPEASTREVARRLLYLEVHRLFVEDHGKLVGVISTSDLVRMLATERV